MSTSQTVPTSVKFTVKRKMFDLDKFQKTSLEGSGEFTPVASLNEALARVGNDQTAFVGLINAALLRQEKKAVKESLQSDNPNVVSSAKSILDFANQFRSVAPYSKIEDRKKQTEAIFAFIRSNEALMSALRTIANAITASDEDEDEENEE